MFSGLVSVSQNVFLSINAVFLCVHTLSPVVLGVQSLKRTKVSSRRAIPKSTVERARQGYILTLSCCKNSTVKSTRLSNSLTMTLNLTD